MADVAEVIEEAEEAEAHAPYIKVWVALLVLTVLEYFYAKWMSGNMTALILGLLLLAGVKAGLVGWYFMHVKFEGRWVYALIVPATILAVILVCGLIPDIASQHVDPMEDEETAAWAVPMERGERAAGWVRV